MSRAIIHVDMDAFYASVEQRDNPELRGRPVIVGGHPRRGVVIAASYEVRPFGVRSAMSMIEATRRAPQAIVVPPRPAAYAQASSDVFSIFERFTPDIEPLSLDEAFLDVTGSQGLFGAPSVIARTIRDSIERELNLPASAGIASVKFVAKIASDVAKPNGQHEVQAADLKSFLNPLPIARLWGVGEKTERQLRSLGIRTVGDLAALDPLWIEKKLGGSRGLWDLANGIDPRPVISDRDARSIGSEDTFDRDLTDIESLRPHLHAQALRVGARLRKSQMKTRVVQLKLKDSDFHSTTRRTTLADPTDDGQALYRTAMSLLTRDPPTTPIRLTGVSAQELVPPGAQQAQLGLFQPRPGSQDRLNAAVDRINQRYGDMAVVTADLTTPDKSPVLRGSKPEKNAR